jgi:uncharacterized protein YkwD
MLRDLGIVYKAASENIAKGASLEKIMTGIMANSARRANILSNRYSEMGIAVEPDTENSAVLIVVQLFIE